MSTEKELHQLVHLHLEDKDQPNYPLIASALGDMDWPHYRLNAEISPLARVLESTQDLPVEIFGPVLKTVLTKIAGQPIESSWGECELLSMPLSTQALGWLSAYLSDSSVVPELLRHAAQTGLTPLVNRCLQQQVLGMNDAQLAQYGQICHATAARSGRHMGSYLPTKVAVSQDMALLPDHPSGQDWLERRLACGLDLEALTPVSAGKLNPAVCQVLQTLGGGHAAEVVDMSIIGFWAAKGDFLSSSYYGADADLDAVHFQIAGQSITLREFLEQAAGQAQVNDLGWGYLLASLRAKESAAAARGLLEELF